MNYDILSFTQIIAGSFCHAQPVRNFVPSRPSLPSSYHEMHPLLFYIITIAICAVPAWLISGLISTQIFDPSKPSGWFEGVSRFFHNIGPYVVFLGGLAGCLWYNLSHAYEYNFKEIILSFLCGILGSIAVGVVMFLLAIVIQIVIVIAAIVFGLAILGCGS